ncbi:MAG: hypothetical protein IJB43_09040 [Clostridia bacterium]|nr:hypothetical protein [Clostridia bacterium]
MLDEFIEAFTEWMVDTVAAVYDGLKWLITLPFRMIKQSRRYILIRKLEKALGIRLRDWQIKYIFGECDDMPGGRGCGKTLAHCIHLCLSKGDPIIVKNKRIQIAYLDEQHGWQYCEHYTSMLREVYYKLMFSRIKLRDIVFIRSNTMVEGKQDGKGKRKRKNADWRR